MTGNSIGHDELVLFVCGELEEGRRQQVEKALLADPSLAREVDEMSRALAALATGERIAPSPDFNAALLAKLGVERAVPLGRSTGFGRRRVARWLQIAAAAAGALALMALFGLFGGGQGAVAWADVVATLATVPQFHLTAFVEEDDEEFKVDIYYKAPGTWRGHGGGVVQFITPDGDARYYDASRKEFVEKREAPFRPLPEEVRGLAAGQLLDGLLRATFRGEPPPGEPVKAVNERVEEDIQVFDYGRDPRRLWARIWVLKASRLPLRMNLYGPEGDDMSLVVFDYSDPQPDGFFDPEKFAAEVKERRLRDVRGIYRAGQMPVGQKPRGRSQIHDLQGYRAPEFIEMLTNRDGDLKIAATDPQNLHPNGSRVLSTYERELRDNWGNIYLSYYQHTDYRSSPRRMEQCYMPVSPFNHGAGEHTITLRYAITEAGGTGLVEAFEETVPIPEPQAEGTAKWPSNVFWKHQAYWHFLGRAGTLQEKLAFIEPLVADPEGPSFHYAVPWYVRLLRGYEGEEAAYRFFEQHLLQRAIKEAFADDRQSIPLSEYLYYLLDAGRGDEIPPILAKLEQSKQRTLESKKQWPGEYKSFKRRLETERPYGVLVAMNIPEAVEQRKKGPKPRLRSIVHSRDGFVCMEFDRLGEQVRTDVQPEWGRHPDVDPISQWEARACLFKDDKLFLAAEGSGEMIDVVFHPLLYMDRDNSWIPRIRWPIRVDVPAASAVTAEEAVREHMPDWNWKPPEPRELAPFQRVRGAADRLFNEGDYEAALKQYQEAADMSPEDLPEFARHPANEGTVEGLFRLARLGVVKCLIKLERLDEAEELLNEIEEDRPNLRDVTGETEFDAADRRARAMGGWWRQCDDVRWMLIQARRTFGRTKGANPSARPDLAAP